MDSMIDMESARALVSSLLWPQVRAFLWDFAPQIHPSRLAAAPFAALDANPAAIADSRVKKAILEAAGVEPCFHAFPQDDGSRLLLLDAAILEQACKWMGAIACAPALRRAVDSKTVRGLKAVLPGVYPEVFSYMAYFAGFEPPAGATAGKTGAEAVATAGVNLLSAAVARVPEPLLKRLELKLPESLCALRSAGFECPEALPRFMKLLKLKFPEAYKTCCL